MLNFKNNFKLFGIKNNNSFFFHSCQSPASLPSVGTLQLPAATKDLPTHKKNKNKQKKQT